MGQRSIFELEVYGGTPKMDMNGLADAIKVEAPKKGDTQLKVTLPTSDEYDVTYNGTDYEQVVGAQADDGTIPIYQPIVDTQVKVSFKVTKKSDKNTYTFKEVPVTVPGKFQVEAGDNIAPEVLPQLREWKGRSGSFAPTAQTRVVYDNDDFKTLPTSWPPITRPCLAPSLLSLRATLPTQAISSCPRPPTSPSVFRTRATSWRSPIP